MWRHHNMCWTDTFLFISHTTNVLLFKFLCNIFIGVKIVKEMPGSVASRTHCVIASMFSMSISIFWLMSKYMLAKIIVALPIITSKTTVFSSERCFISKVSTWLLVTTSNTAARFLPSTDGEILYFFVIPTILFLTVYGSWTQLQWKSGRVQIFGNNLNKSKFYSVRN